MSFLRSAAIALASLTLAGCSVFFPTGGGNGADQSSSVLPKPTGCPASPNKELAPGGYYVNGNTVCTADGKPHLFHGVDRPSLEWIPSGERLTAADLALMGSWHANVVRVALNQDFWLSASPFHDDGYAARVDDVVTWSKAAGMDVILDLHWSDGGVLGSCTDSCQHVMADQNSLTFWTEVATRYKGDGRVLFELYNEPHDVEWAVWKSGGSTSEGWMAVGMQQLYDAVRAAGAHNLVIIGGLDWAFDLSGVKSHRIAGYNIMYATHPYGGSASRAPDRFGPSWGYLTATDPVMATEFGDLTGDCSATYTTSVIEYADSHNASWSAWAWFPGGCTFPSLIKDWPTATPTESGTVVRAALARYAGVPVTVIDAGAPAGDGGTATGDGGSAADAGGAN